MGAEGCVVDFRISTAFDNESGKSVLYGGFPADVDNRVIEENEIKELKKLNWIKEKSFIFLAACNLDDGKDSRCESISHFSRGAGVFFPSVCLFLRGLSFL